MTVWGRSCIIVRSDTIGVAFWFHRDVDHREMGWGPLKALGSDYARKNFCSRGTQSAVLIYLLVCVLFPCTV
jgi:hypothetical protein